MMTLATLQNYCTTQLALIRNHTRPVNIAINTVCATLADPGYVTPTQPELVNFLTTWKAILQEINPPRPGLIDAIELLEFRNEFPWNSFFTNVNPLQFALQLAIRVARPQDINQAEVDFCGQASLLFLYAQRSPEHYVSFCIDLVTTGVGHLRDSLIEPIPQIKAAPIPDGMKEVDYVALASIRNALDVSHVPGVLSAAVQGTQPTLLAGTLRKMGFTNVVDRISFRNIQSHMRPRSYEHDDAISLSRLVQKIDTHGSIKPSTKTAFEAEDAHGYLVKLKTLQEACNKLGQHHFVIIAIDPGILNALNGGRMRTSLSEDQYLHYVAVQILVIHGRQVQMRVFSWGRYYQGTLHIHDFLSRFAGYISAQP
ncbi:MAG: hypothetical protein KF796_10610 [Ramlibacter sp.]|nr:hypothetical protein [Ramlibacter sp.]